jgi:subtilase family serine protease
LYYADHQVTRAEADKTNNIAYVPLSVTESQPDLRIQQAALATNTIMVGTSVNLTAFLNNAGTAASGSSKVGYYLSTDSTYSANDLLLTTDNNSGLGVGNSVALNNSITLSNATLAGNYYILFYADYQNSVGENNENNNVEAVAVTVTLPLPDLFLNNAVVSAPAIIYAGDVINVSCVINNNSIQGVGNHRLGYYLNAVPVPMSTAPLLGDVLITGVASNGSVSQSMNLTIPAGTTAGYYYIAFYIDDQLVITESNESNNRVYRQIYVAPPNLPDATVQWASINTSSAIVGETIVLSSRIRNIGNTGLSNGTLSYYLSPTPTYNSSTAVFLDNVNAVYPLSYYKSMTNNVVIPANTAAGNYYILFYADAPNLIVESDESNNIAAVAITIRELLPDLEVLHPSAVYTNGNLHVSAFLTNIGTAASGVTTLGYFLSTDNLYDSGDVLLGTDAVGIMSPSSHRSEDGDFSPVAGMDNGVYYVLFVADYLQVDQEEDEANNIAASAGVSITVNINQLPTAEMRIYPNPTLQSVAIELGRTYQEVQVKVYNPLGQLIQTTRPQTAANLSLDLEGPTGVYLLQITTKEGSFEGIPIVKE